MHRTSALVRTGVAVFCWLTAAYAFVTSSAFAYLQFIKPRVFHWVGFFADWHPALFWVWFGALVVVLAADIRPKSAGRIPAFILVFSSAIFGIWNSVHPVLASLSDGPRSLAVGIGALVPLLWLALVDHLASLDWLRAARPSDTEQDRRGVEGRLLTAAVAAAFLVVVAYAAMASTSIGRAFEPDLLTAGLALAVWSSLVDQLLIYSGVFLVLSVVGRLVGGRFLWHYVALLAVVTYGCAAAFASLVGGALGLSEASTWMAAVATGLSVAGTWGGWRVRRSAASGRLVSSATDVFVLAPGRGEADARSVLRVAAVFPLAYLLQALASLMDWDFVILDSGVLIVWVTAFVAVCRATPLRPGVGNWTIGVACALPLMAQALLAPSPSTTHILERYAVHNASFRLAEDAIRQKPEEPSFGRFLRAHTGLTDVSVAPIAIDIVPNLTATTGPKPLVFLIVIDSLRPDYLSPYNPAVRFTPRIAEFADSGVVFANAFTRYGGTGLSMPAIWAGSALAHKQYVLPFASMNALEKVLDVNGYRRIMSRDHITTALWTARATDVELDLGRAEMEFDLCGTLDELGEVLGADVPADGALFMQTRSLNLHVAGVRHGYVPPGKTYPGFEPPYAWRVERMDGCFGRFIDRLKQLGLYDRSLVVLTSDHGELVGEDGRWGHSYHMFPEVIQVPLLMHLPDALRASIVDPHAASLLTDITPTIYEVLGYRPRRVNGLMGRSLVGVDNGEVGRHRREESYVLAASYGAVYAVLSRNGRQLYIADASKGIDHAYRRSSGTWVEKPVDSWQRATGQRHIRRYLDEVARVYHLNPRY